MRCALRGLLGHGVGGQRLQRQVQVVALGNQLPVRHGLWRDKADGRARQACAARAAHAVRVVVGGARQVVVDDHGQRFNVNAACGQIGGHQHLPAVGFELAQHGLARALAQFAMKGRCVNALGVELVGNVLGTVAAGHKHQHALAGVLLHQLAQQGAAACGIHMNGPLRNRGVLLVRVFHANAVVVVTQQLVDQTFYRRAEGGRQQQRLALAFGGQQGQHLLQFFGKAQIQQAVGFVHHQGLQGVELELAVRHHIQQAAGGGNHHVYTAAQGHQLGVDGDTARQHRHLGAVAQCFAQVVDQLGHLRSQLARGHQDQRLRGAGALALGCIAQHPRLQQRQHISRCFARARGRTGAQILALHNRGNGLGLNGCGRNQALGGSGVGQRRSKAKGGKGHRRAKSNKGADCRALRAVVCAKDFAAAAAFGNLGGTFGAQGVQTAERAACNLVSAAPNDRDGTPWNECCGENNRSPWAGFFGRPGTGRVREYCWQQGECATDALDQSGAGMGADQRLPDASHAEKRQLAQGERL